MAQGVNITAAQLTDAGVQQVFGKVADVFSSRICI